MFLETGFVGLGIACTRGVHGFDERRDVHLGVNEDATMRAVKDRDIGKPRPLGARLFDEILAALQACIFQHLCQDALAPVALHLVAALQRRHELVGLTTERLGLETYFVQLALEALAQLHIRLASRIGGHLQLAERGLELIKERLHVLRILKGQRLRLACQGFGRKNGELLAQRVEIGVVRLLCRLKELTELLVFRRKQAAALLILRLKARRDLFVRKARRAACQQNNRHDGHGQRDGQNHRYHKKFLSVRLYQNTGGPLKKTRGREESYVESEGS